MIHISSYIVITTSVGWLSTWVYAHLLIDLIFFQRTAFGNIVIVVLQIFKEPVFAMLLWFSKIMKKSKNRSKTCHENPKPKDWSMTLL
jgi:hypothetical protein